MGAFFAELIGTLALVFLGVGSVVVTQGLGESGLQSLVGIALAHGLTIAAFGSALGHVSGGHFNPAVTIAMLVAGRINAAKSLLYIVAQCLGATIGAALLLAAMPTDWTSAVKLGVPALAPNITVVGGLILEFVTTFFLVLVIFGTAVDRRASKLGAILIGFTVAIDILAIGPLTGAAMNPARWFGPAIMGGHFENFWLYWLAPIVGGVSGALFYQSFMMEEEITVESTTENATESTAEV
jgi:aquaporin TIP